MLAAGLIGLILGDVTARTGNLSLAMGLHFANNAIALLLVAMPSPLAALSLYLAPVDPATDRPRCACSCSRPRGTARRLRASGWPAAPGPPAIAFAGAGFYLVG